jgi:flagellar biosynthesis/type III secretory pathway chaperone
MATSCLPELVSELTGKKAVLEELVKVLEAEQRSIVEIDMPGIDACDSRKRELLASLERSSGRCRQLLKEAGQELNAGGVECISSLLAKVPPPLRSSLASLQARLQEQGDSLKRQLDFNRGLLEGSISHLQESLEFLNGLFTRRQTYGEAGGMISSNDNVRLVCKEI